MVLDLGSLKSIREFAQNLKNDYTKIDILINNAGVSYPRNQRLQTTDGFEIQFGVNHLGHFYLTSLIKDLIAKASGNN